MGMHITNQDQPINNNSNSLGHGEGANSQQNNNVLIQSANLLQGVIDTYESYQQAVELSGIELSDLFSNPAAKALEQLGGELGFNAAKRVLELTKSIGNQEPHERSKALTDAMRQIGERDRQITREVLSDVLRNPKLALEKLWTRLY